MGMYSEQYLWNSLDFDKGNLEVCYKQYSIPHTVVFGKVEVRATSRIIGMGSVERHWGDVKTFSLEIVGIFPQRRCRSS